jgi:hypothetical protein
VGTPHNEWYTPAHILEVARATLGQFDLDPATCPKAQATVQAENCYTMEDDGFLRPWYGRVWLNPPYCRNAPAYGDNRAGTYHWMQKALREYRSGRVTALIALVNRSDGEWYQDLATSFSALYQCRKRIRFEAGLPGAETSAPRYSNDLLYLGASPDIFWGNCSKALGPPALSSFR